MNDIIYFTITAILLYVAADKILVTIERLRGGHFKNRSMIFFAIIMVMAIGTFEVLRQLLPPKETPPVTQEAPPAEAAPATNEAPASESAPTEEEIPRVNNPPRVE